ncbi:hypothetical protein GCM10007071_33700 [Marinobacter zhanjiangensis]|uniref:Uncharacterized protein n=1 Tax=Marinobacter zhanjiangensis TaxID=578215 RepID=A0ABQ3B8E2_9GAMM|nr:hypothetical protein GCM10007071_33700 [Marinobacter zhanjiangensis]
MNVINGRARLTADFIEFASQKWMRFSLWLVLGEKFENDEVCINDLASPNEFDKEQTSWKLEKMLDELQTEYEGKSKDEILELIENINKLKNK